MRGIQQYPAVNGDGELSFTEEDSVLITQRKESIRIFTLAGAPKYGTARLSRPQS